MTVRTDEKRLRQILINLLSNAIKYTPEGEASLTVRYRGLIAEFDVSDTGIGIPAAEIDRVFEPFERGSAKWREPSQVLSWAWPSPAS